MVTNQKNNMSNILPKFTIKQLLEAGVHFGHKTMRRNPKMAKYIHSNRNGISIIDLNQTSRMLHQSLITCYEIAKNNGRILFVSTKKQGSPIVAEAAKRCGQYYVNFRWLGGMLTNFKTVSQSIKTLKKIEEQLGNDEIGLNKKERLVLERKREKLEQALGGIKNMGGYPDLLFVIDTNKEDIAISEAKKLNVPIMAIVDSNCNPDDIKYIIPGNDDSAKAIRLYCSLISDAIIAGIRENMAASGVDLSKIAANSLPKTDSNLKLEKKSSSKTEYKNSDVVEEKTTKKRIIIDNSEDNKKDADKKSSEKKVSDKKSTSKKTTKK